MESSNTTAGATFYKPLVLRFYDFIVLKFSNTLAWRCPTATKLLPFFTENLSQNHLDIGVGTGYYLRQAVASGAITNETKVTLLDLNQNTLNAASNQLEATMGPKVQTVLWDIMRPLPLFSPDDASSPMKFDSISLFYLLHCMPGPLSAKSSIFAHLKNNLSDKGVLYGATILGKGERIRHNLLGRLLMRIYNRTGVFSNVDDTEDGFVEALKLRFDEVETSVVGVVLMFRAKGVKGDDD